MPRGESNASAPATEEEWAPVFDKLVEWDLLAKGRDDGLLRLTARGWLAFRVLQQFDEVDCPEDELPLLDFVAHATRDELDAWDGDWLPGEVD